METFKSKAYGASGDLIGGKKLKPMEVGRSQCQSNQVLIEVLYCGVCHSDVHQVENDWKNTLYPCVPGHEIVGKIVEAGALVSKFRQGDIVGVGCMIDSCRKCEQCVKGEEQFCLGPVGPTMTYNGYFKPDDSGFNTFGGYSTHIVVSEDFIIRIPTRMNLKAVAPILCAGVTTYSPLKHWKIQPGMKVGVIGVGGLGHMAIMLAKALGAEVWAITTREEKRSAALELGATGVIISENKDEMKKHELHFDFILCTIPDTFDINPYISLLKPRGNLVTVGLLASYTAPTNNMEVAKSARSVGGSLIGGIAETQEVIDFCDKHGILPQVEMIDIKDINDAFEKMKNEEVRFRYVIDMSALQNCTE